MQDPRLLAVCYHAPRLHRLLLRGSDAERA